MKLFPDWKRLEMDEDELARRVAALPSAIDVKMSSALAVNVVAVIQAKAVDPNLPPDMQKDFRQLATQMISGLCEKDKRLRKYLMGGFDRSRDRYRQAMAERKVIPISEGQINGKGAS